MSYQTFARGWKEANDKTTLCLNLESRLPQSSCPPSIRLPALLPLFTSYLSAAHLYSSLLTSGLLSPKTTPEGRKQREDIIKRWRMVLDRAERVKVRIKDLGGEVPRLSTGDGGAGAGSAVVTKLDLVVDREARSGSSSSPGGTAPTGMNEFKPLKQAREAQLAADQISRLRQSSTITLITPVSKSVNSDIPPKPDRTIQVPLLESPTNPLYARLTVDQTRSIPLTRPEFSDAQIRSHAKWARPLGPPATGQVLSTSEGGEGSGSGWRVEQGVGANCSVVVALGCCLEWNRRFGGQLGVGNFIPVKEERRMRGKAEEPEDGAERYWKVKVFVNGTWRYVVIDDRLPISDTSDESMHAIVIPSSPDDDVMTPRPTSSIDSITSPQLWIPLLEKTYMTLHGSYVFPGSGSEPSTDLHTLTGWIPERLMPASGTFQREKTWSRLYTAFGDGTCMIALGTGKAKIPIMPLTSGKTSTRSRGRNAPPTPTPIPSEARGQMIRGIELVPSHAYGVKDMRISEDGMTREVVVENPWRKGRSRRDERQGGWTRGMLDALEEEDSPHTFILTWEEICSSFSTIHVNWNPSMFERSVSFHGTWPSSTGTDATAADPRFRLTVDAPTAGASVRMLLSRHVRSTKTPRPPISLHAIESGSRSTGDRLSLGNPLAAGGGELDYLCADWVSTTSTTISAHSEIQLLPLRDAGTDLEAFTLTVYSDANLTLAPEATLLPFVARVAGRIENRSAGGHPGHPTHIFNPQYRLDITPDAGQTSDLVEAVQLMVKTGSAVPINVKLVWSSGERVVELTDKDVQLDSGSYAFGFAFAEKSSIKSGTYGIIISTYEPGVSADFSLEVSSTSRVRLQPIPQEGAGLYNRHLRSTWTEALAGGRVGSESYAQNPTFEVTVPQPCTLSARLQLRNATGAPINLSVYHRAAGGRLGELVASTGAYNDRVSGILLDRFLAEPGIYLIVASTYSAGWIGGLALAVYSDKAVEVVEVKV